MEIILAIALGFLITFIAYRQGLKDGQSLKREETIKPMAKSPVEAIKERIEAKKLTPEEHAEQEKANSFYD